MHSLLNLATTARTLLVNSARLFSRKMLIRAHRLSNESSSSRCWYTSRSMAVSKSSSQKEADMMASTVALEMSRSHVSRSRFTPLATDWQI